MSDSKKLRTLLREFINEVVTAGDFKDGEIRPENNYRPEGNYRSEGNDRPAGNYRPADAKAYLGMSKSQDEAPPEGGEDDNIEGGSGASDSDVAVSSTPANGQADDNSDDSQQPTTNASKQPEWKNPLI